MTNAVGSPIKGWLRLEALAMTAAGLLVWAGLGGGWWRFAVLVLLPDLSILGYLHGPRLGAALYNVAHSYALPVAIGTLGGVLDQRALLLTGAIWLTHIGADRLLGYGLKYPTGFRDTHLGRIGQAAAPYPLTVSASSAVSSPLSPSLPPSWQRTGEHLAQLLNPTDSTPSVPAR